MITNNRVIFVPNVVERFLREKTMEWPLHSLIAVEEQPRGKDILSGGIRKRLRTTFANNNVEIFVVRKLAEVVRDLRQAQN